MAKGTRYGSTNIKANPVPLTWPAVEVEPLDDGAAAAYDDAQSELEAVLARTHDEDLGFELEAVLAEASDEDLGFDPLVPRPKAKASVDDWTAYVQSLNPEARTDGFTKAELVAFADTLEAG